MNNDSASEQAPMSDRDHEELRMLYGITVTDLSYFKQQQWSVTNYALLAEAGLIGIAQLLGEPLPVADRGVLACLAVAAAVVALFVLNKLQRSVSLRQARLDAVRETLGDPFKRAWAAKHKPEDAVQSVLLLRGGILVTAALTVWLVWWRL